MPAGKVVAGLQARQGQESPDISARSHPQPVEEVESAEENTAEENASRDIASRDIASKDIASKDIASKDITAGDGAENAEETVLARVSGFLEDNIRRSERIIGMTGLSLHALLGRSGGQLSGRGGGYVGIVDPASQDKEGHQTLAAVPSTEQQLEYWDQLRQILRKLPINAPLDYFNLSSGYGKRRDPFTGRRGVMHYGADLSSWPGSSIYATAPGRVRSAERRPRYGYAVEIDHGNGIRTLYGHMRRIYVNKGQEVFYRQKIGQVGSTGRSTGPHVHYEISYKGKSMDPMRFIAAGRFPFKDMPLAVAIPPRKPAFKAGKK